MNNSCIYSIYAARNLSDVFHNEVSHVDKALDNLLVSLRFAEESSAVPNPGHAPYIAYFEQFRVCLLSSGTAQEQEDAWAELDRRSLAITGRCIYVCWILPSS
jgi:hypothetical protein